MLVVPMKMDDGVLALGGVLISTEHVLPRCSVLARTVFVKAEGDIDQPTGGRLDGAQIIIQPGNDTGLAILVQEDLLNGILSERREGKV